MESFIFYTLKSSLCLSAGYLLYFLLLRRETFHRFKRFTLIGIIVASLLIPLIRINLHSTVVSIPVQKLETTILTETPVTTVLQQTTMPAMTAQPGHFTIRPLLLVYLTGAGLQAILILFALARIIIIFRKSEKIRYGNMRLAVTTSSIVPFCFGRHILISRKDLEENKNAILLHEMTHLKKGHNLDLILLEAYLLITWYNPFSWLIRKELKQNHEFEADRNVLRQGIDDSYYQLLLVRTVAGEQRYRLANSFNQSNLKTRIVMMNKRKSNSLAILKAALFLPLIALMIQAFAQKSATPAGTLPTNPATGKYLRLPIDQLKILGFEVNSTGLFYKNQRVDKPGRQTLCLFFTQKTYSGSMTLKPGEVISGHDAKDRILKNQSTTNFDYYPMLVSWINGFWTLLNIPKEDLPKELLPIQINMADLKTLNRTDTLVFWFNPTESLRKTLAPVAKIDDYLQSCPPDARDAALKGKKKK